MTFVNTLINRPGRSRRANGPLTTTRLLVSLLAFALLGFSYTGCSGVDLKGRLYHAKTTDNRTISLEYFPALKKTNSLPVIVCHGLMANRHYFKMNEQQSLVVALQKAGFEVYLMDLRGRPSNGTNGWLGGPGGGYDYTMDDYIKYDMDAAITQVLLASGKPKVNWVGHSMGGIIAYARLGSYGEDRIANLVTLASPGILYPANKTLTIASQLYNASFLTPTVPVKMMAAAEADTQIPFTNAYIAQLLWNADNMDDNLEKKVMRYVAHDVAKGVMLQFLEATYRGYFYSNDKKINYSKNIANVKVPALVFSAKMDGLADPITIRYAYETLGSTDKTLHFAARSHGYSADYGHVDIVMGPQAHKEIFPKITDWLNEHQP